MKFRYLAIVIMLFGALPGFGQKFRFSEFSFANNGGPGTPNDPIGGAGYHGSPDWVEIYNTSSTATYSLSGWYLSDDRYNLRKWQFPTQIPLGNYLKVDSHKVVVIFLCGHDAAVIAAAGTNSATIGVDLHTNFSVDQTKPGTKIYLSENNGSLVNVRDSIDVYRYKNKPGHSWGREFRQDGGLANPPSPHTWLIPLTWKLYQTPTPGLPNPYHPAGVAIPNPPAWYVDYCPTPQVTPKPGYYAGGPPALTITDTACALGVNNAWYNYQGYGNVEINGTNDCTPPVYNSTAQGFSQVVSGGTPGTPLTGNFNAGPPPNLGPVAMVRIMTHDASVPQRYLDGFEFYGAYLDDTLRQYHQMSVTCVCVDTNLFLQALPPAKDSMPMIIHHFDKNDKDAFKGIGQGHVRKVDFFNPIGPGTNRKQWQFVFRSEDEYGYNYRVNSKLFTDATLGYSDRSDFREILFRSAAEENYLFPGLLAPTNQFLPAHIRDFFNHTMGLRHKLKYEQAHYAPTYMVINGLPHGIYYIKEQIDTLYTGYYYDRYRAAIVANNIYGPAQNVSPVTTPTGLTQWNWFYSWAMQTNTNVHVPTLYYRISDSLDFNSLNDYMIYNMLSVNTDFIKRYGIWWKGLPNDTADHRTTQAKWRFALSNTDFTWGYDRFNSAGVANLTPTSDPCDFMAGYSLSWPSYGNNAGNGSYPIVPLWFKLMANDTFKSEFITRYSDLLNTALTCDSLTDHLKYVRSLLTKNSMAGHAWYNMGDANGVCIGCDSVKYWNDQLDSMKIYIMQRCTLVNQGLTNCFPEIQGPFNLCVNVDPPNSGYVQLNSLTLKNFIWNGKYFDSIINVLKAYPYQNYVFDHWEADNKYTLSPNIYSDSVTFYVPSDGCVTAIFKLRPAHETYGTPLIPSGFSPNGDGNNDIFNVYGIAEASSYELEVYNRWGEQIFRSADKSEGWNGKFNGTDVPAGVYAWRYNIIINGKTFKEKGNITLVR